MEEINQFFFKMTLVRFLGKFDSLLVYLAFHRFFFQHSHFLFSFHNFLILLYLKSVIEM